MKVLELEILTFVGRKPFSSSKEIHEGIESQVGYATIKRALAKLLASDYIHREGRGRATTYQISPSYDIVKPIDIDQYFEKEIDERAITDQFSLGLIPAILPNVSLFTYQELERLDGLQAIYLKNMAELTEPQIHRELERLAIDLSWKSSQIEGNTYTLLETERLLKEQKTADGRTRDEATMLLNHKEALDFVIDNPDYLDPVQVSRIEDVHSILIKDLGIERNIRNRRVGIAGTNYKPLDKEFQIREALQQTCDLVNAKENVFEKAFLLLVLLSYIQAFNDGNKRTARIVSNACLIRNKYCPISFRTVDSIDYKKAMLIFYEQNNISAFKTLFIEQFAFAVNTYF